MTETGDHAKPIVYSNYHGRQAVQDVDSDALESWYYKANDRANRRTVNATCNHMQG